MTPSIPSYIFKQSHYPSIPSPIGFSSLCLSTIHWCYSSSSSFFILQPSYTSSRRLCMHAFNSSLLKSSSRCMHAYRPSHLCSSSQCLNPSQLIYVPAFSLYIRLILFIFQKSLSFHPFYSSCSSFLFFSHPMHLPEDYACMHPIYLFYVPAVDACMHIPNLIDFPADFLSVHPWISYIFH